MYGDCVEGIRNLPPSSVDLVIADPPYNIAVQGSAWDTVPDYLSWSAKWLEASMAALRPGGSLFIYGSPVKLWICHLKILAAQLGLEFKQHISWVYKRARCPRRQPAAERAQPTPEPSAGLSACLSAGPPGCRAQRLPTPRPMPTLPAPHAHPTRAP